VNAAETTADDNLSTGIRIMVYSRRKPELIFDERIITPTPGMQPQLGEGEHADLFRLWLLRLLVPLGVYRVFITQFGYNDSRVAAFLHLKEWTNLVAKRFVPGKLPDDLRRLHREAELNLKHAQAPGGLRTNIDRLAALLGLTVTDCRLLEFAVLIHSDGMLDDMADLLGKLSHVKLMHVLAVLLDVPEQDVRLSLASGGPLAESGLLTVRHSSYGVLRVLLDLISENFITNVQRDQTDPITLLRDIIIPSKPPRLIFEDYEHITEYLAILRPYLRKSFSTGRHGVNIFLHGMPGTGKTELSRLLAQEVGCELFEVTSEDEAGNAIDGEHRLRALRAAQRMLGHRHALLLFDETEDVFGGSNGLPALFMINDMKRISKGWLNRALGENAVPTLWVSNTIRTIDPAYIRRFDMVIELPIPPRQQRERIVRQAGAGMLSDVSVHRIARAENLAPAVITRAVGVVDCLRDELGGADLSATVERLVNCTLEAQGHRAQRGQDADCLPGTYDPACIQTDVDLAVVAKGLARSKSGRLCLYGPPGTGKTAFGRWLSDTLGVPLNVKRASDLIAPYVGMTERNIAESFRQAERDGAVLLIDEVDSFLRDRREARHSWEVTEVNEMLTQMESYSGVFIASTNLMDGLDQASLRRFDLKVRFDYLKSTQALRLLLQYCLALGLPSPSSSVQSRLARLSLLTPGDFAAVARQHRFRPIISPTALVVALEQECQLKHEGRRHAIGFF